MAALLRGFLTLLFSITLIELFVGGGGRVFEIGPLTLRMILFMLNLVVISVLWVYHGKISMFIMVVALGVGSVLLAYAFLGMVNGAEASLIAEDIKPLSYFFSILFLGYYIDGEKRMNLVVSLIKYSSLFMAVVYLFIQVLFYLNKINYLPFARYVYANISPTDFIFRGTEGLFFYKGFMYMVVGLIFWIHSSGTKHKAVAILTIMIAMILTGTRGFILMFGFVYALFYGIPLLLKLNVKMLILAGVLVFGSIFFFGSRDIGDKDESDSARVKQVVQVIQDINPVTLFIGHGFGIGVPVRPVHMEIGYLEVFHKQGLVGLCIWGIFLIYLYNAYVRKKNFENIRKAFFLSVIFMVLLSLTNPFFNNPMGISLLIISLAVFNVLNKMKEENKREIQVTNQMK